MDLITQQMQAIHLSEEALLIRPRSASPERSEETTTSPNPVKAPTSFNCIPTEIKSQIFDYLSFEDKIRVSQVCRKWAVVVQFSPKLKFSATLNDETLKFVAERLCPLDVLKIENWTSVLLPCVEKQLLYPVKELRLKGGIARHNLENLLGGSGGTVSTLTFQRCFFNSCFSQYDFPMRQAPSIEWKNLLKLNFKIPGVRDPSDDQTLLFIQRLLSNAFLPELTDLSFELGRKLGAEGSRVNRNGKFPAEIIVPLVMEIFRFIALHKGTIKNLKLIFLFNIWPGEGKASLEEDEHLGQSLQELNLRTVRVRYYNNKDFEIPLVRHLVVGATALSHIEYEHQDFLYPEVYAAVERNARTLKTIILETRTDGDRTLPANPGDIYNHLEVVKKCQVLDTLHLRGHGGGGLELFLNGLLGIPPTIRTLRITCEIGSLYEGESGLNPFFKWVKENLPFLTSLETGDPENEKVAKVKATSMSDMDVDMYGNNGTKEFDPVYALYMVYNWFRDYADSMLSAQNFI